MNKYKHPVKNPNKTLTDNIKRWVESNVETFDDAVVVGVSKYADRLVDVLPLAIQEDEDGVLIYPATITNCPVILQGNLDGFLHFPLRVGDKVKIGYPKESSEEFVYSSTTEQYVPVDTMKWNNRQAFVVGYASQVGQDYTLSTTDFELRYFDSRVTITPDNKITITTPNATIEADQDGFIGATNGAITLSLQSSGEGSLVNNSGSVTLQSGGNILANGATINISGNVITASGTDLDQTRADLDSFKTAYEAHGSGAPNHPPPPPF